jgi:hypothetical protein
MGRTSIAPIARAQGVRETMSTTASSESASMMEKPASGTFCAVKDSGEVVGVPCHARTVVTCESTPPIRAPFSRSAASCSNRASCSGLGSSFQSCSAPYARHKNFIEMAQPPTKYKTHWSLIRAGRLRVRKKKNRSPWVSTDSHGELRILLFRFCDPRKPMSIRGFRFSTAVN